MPISFSRYIDITSLVGGADAVRRRELIGRVYTNSSLIPNEEVREFDDETSVGVLFGTDSEEFRRAQFYFEFVSKISTTPQRLSFYRFGPAVSASSPSIVGFANSFNPEGIVGAGIGVEIAGVRASISVSTTNAQDADAVATAFQAAVQSAITTDNNFSQATVVFDSDQFTLTGGVEGALANGNARTISVSPENESGTALLQNLGFVTVGASSPVVTVGSNAATAVGLTEALTRSVEISNNFGTFCLAGALTEELITEASNWNAAPARNLLFQFHTQVRGSNAFALSEALINNAGTGASVNESYDGSGVLPTAFPEMLPMAAIAATDYSRANATINLMFQVSNQSSGVRLTPTVETDALANFYDNLRVNYYGQTQQGGSTIEFYQRGFLFGDQTVAPISMNEYANEQWLKDFAGTALGNLLIASPRVPANPAGRSQVLAILREVIEQALTNGVISVGRTLTTSQRAFITNVSGDPNAFQQVQNAGSWINATITRRTVNDVEEGEVDYTIIYARDEVVRKINGTHILI